MALAQDGTWSVTFMHKDNNGKYASWATRLPGTLSLAEVETRINALYAAVTALSDAPVVNAYASRSWGEDTPVAAPASSEVERKLRIELGTNEFNSVSSVEVPSPIFGIEISGTDVVDLQHPAVATFVNLLIAGSLGPGNGSVTYFGEDLTRASAPIVVHRKRKGRK